MSNDTPEETIAEQNDSQAGAPETEAAPQAETASPEPAAAEAGLPELTLGSGAPADATRDPDYKPVIRGRIDRFGVAMGTGRRKTSVARVRIKPGSGAITINDRTFEDYVPLERNRLMIEQPLKKVDKLGKVDVWVRVNGGGTTGQTGAIILGIARALQAMDPDLHHSLAEGGFLTRDGRMVERKKFGYKKARRSFQFSKR